MAGNRTRAELINMLLDDKQDSRIEEEEILHILLQQKLTKNIDKLQNDNLTFGARMADNIAKFAGSWTFILLFVACLAAWIIINSLFLIKPYDAYPFILLNLILSCVAALQAPVIMMSQNRQEEKDRLRSLNDYKTNLKTEIIIEDIHEKLDQLLANQDKLIEKTDKIEKHINLQK